MAKTLVIKNVDFSANAVSSVTPVISGTVEVKQSALYFSGSVEPLQDGVGRFMNYNATNRNKRIFFTAEEDGLFYIPKGYSIVLTGVLGLLLDFGCYDRNYNYHDFELTLSNKLKQYGEVHTWATSNPGQWPHPYLVTTGWAEHGGGNKYYKVFDGTENVFTFKNIYDGDWFFFCARQIVDQVTNPDDYTITYEVKKI